MVVYYLSFSEIPSRSANSIHVMKMCQAFAGLGSKVLLLARQGRLTVEDDFNFYGVNRCFDLVKCKSHQFGKLLAEWLHARVVADVIKQRPRPDLLFSRHIYSLTLLVNVGIPMFFEAHTPPVNLLQKRVEAWVYRQKHFCRLVVISKALQDEYIRIFPFLSHKKIMVAPDAADPPVASQVPFPNGTWLSQPGRFQVGYTGHLYPGKGMEVIARVASRLPSVDFHVVGGTDPDIEQWKRVRKTENIHFHGFVPPGDLQRYLGYFDVVLAPYQACVLGVGGRKENSPWMSPLKIFEYMGCGKAMVCSDLPVLREILTNEVNALLVPPGDIDAWARALHRLKEDTRLRISLGRAAKLAFLRYHTWDQRAEKILNSLCEAT
jgi:glycosyltransferase involved in cell wall biosynthesis